MQNNYGATQIKKEIEEHFEWIYNNRLQKLVELEIAKQEEHGRVSCIGINGETYLAPQWSELSHICQQEHIVQKHFQGFTEILPVPMALGLKQKFAAYRKQVQTLNSGDTILYSDKKFGSWLNTDIDGELLYFPNSYNDQHGSITKDQWLTDNKTSSGWQIVLIEPRVSIQWRFPAMTNGRQALPNLITPNNLLKLIKTNQDYIGEQAIDLDTYLIFSMLVYPGVILDDSSSLFGSTSLLLGNCLLGQKQVLAGCWARQNKSDRFFSISSWDVDSASGNATTRMVVRIA